MTLAETIPKSGGNRLPLRRNLFGLENTLLKPWQAPDIAVATVRRQDAFVLGFYAKLIEATKGRARVAYNGAPHHFPLKINFCHAGNSGIKDYIVVSRIRKKTARKAV